MYLIGYDIGSSSIKAALTRMDTGELVAVLKSPDAEMSIQAPQPDWAEQDPDNWWQNVCAVTRELLRRTGIRASGIRATGIAYQMHGLVLVDKNQRVLRPAIIWCDSRAVAIGNLAFEALGREKCLSQLLNSPGNFTASKLKWVQDHEPEIYQRIHKFMLPGDYIAMKLTGEIATTASGLSEGILWDFQKNRLAEQVLDYFGIHQNLVPQVVPTCSVQGRITDEAAGKTGLPAGIPVTYRAGDQPNNALSLNVLQPGEVAATGGTSGVVYGVVDRPVYDLQSRVNGFAHVNHSAEQARIGILLCINGAGSQHQWMRQNIALEGQSYHAMEQQAAFVPQGSDGLRILPFGNGAERMLGNLNIGAQVNNLHFNRHTRAHYFRAALEGIGFSFVYGMDILQKMGLYVQLIRAGNDNLFQSAVFAQTVSDLVGCRIEMADTTGAAGAAQAAGVASGFYHSLEDAVKSVRVTKTYEPTDRNEALETSYQNWLSDLKKAIS